MNYEFLKKINIGTLELKNRIVFLAMVKYLCDENGYITDRYIEYYRARAKGGTGLLITGAMIIDPDWPSELPFEPRIYDEKYIPGLKKVAEAVHEAGSKIFFQLWHPGQIAYTTGKTPKTVNQLSIVEIKDIQRKYAAAAKIAKAAGADGVEFQLCHNYLASQFLSPHYNKRTDEYGIGSIKNQTRFAAEAITAIQEAVGKDFPVSVKINGSDFVDDGITPELAAKAALEVEKLGVALITLSGGGADTALTGMSAGGEREEGWKVPFARTVKDVVKTVPIVATDSLRHPRIVDRYLKNGDCDLIGIGRGLVAESDWVKKVEEGREDEIRYCVSCLSCYNYTVPGSSCCTVNPYATREYEVTDLVKNGEGRTVAVVGAGPAGLEAAVILAERGFKPVVFEREAEIGGLVRLAVVPPDKKKLYWIIEYYEKQIARLGIDVRLNTDVTVEDVKKINPYAILVATGSLPIIPHIPGADKKHVFDVREVLNDKKNISGKNVVVIGAGMTGIEAADMYKEMGNTVVVVDMIPTPNPAEMPLEQAVTFGKVVSKGVEFKYGYKLKEIRDHELIVMDEQAKQESILADQVVLSLGVKSNNKLYNDLHNVFSNTYVIGDANNAGRINQSIFSGNNIARII